MNYDHRERCVFIGNIPYKATEGQLREILESFGPIVNIDIKKDPTTGLNSGIAFCEFVYARSAEEARKMNKRKTIDGRQLRIDYPDGGKKGNTSARPVSYCTNLSQEQAHDLLVKVKELIKENEDRARMILINNPSIVFAVDELMKKNGRK